MQQAGTSEQYSIWLGRTTSCVLARALVVLDTAAAHLPDPETAGIPVGSKGRVQGAQAMHTCPSSAVTALCQLWPLPIQLLLS
jgi:hypothetical protein